MTSGSLTEARIWSLSIGYGRRRQPRRRQHHPPLDGEPDPAQMAAEKIVEQLELSRYEVRERQDKPRGHGTP